MEKWERELNHLVNASLPEQVDRRIHLTLDQLKRTRKKSFGLRFGTTAAAAVLVLSFGLTALSPAFAEAMKSIPVIGSVFELVGDVGTKRGSQLNLTTNVGRQIQIDDVAMTITESLYDGSSISLGLIAPADAKDPMGFVKDVTFSVDGKRLPSFSGGASTKILDDGTYAGTLSLHVDDPLPDVFTLGILSRDEAAIYAEIPVERKGENQLFAIAQTGTWNDVEVEYEDMALYPTSTKLSFRLRGTDSPFWEFKVQDDQGRVLQPIGGHGGGTSDDKHYVYDFEPLETVPESLTITPYLVGSDSTTRIDGEWKGTPITLSQGKAGSVTVVDQKFEDDNLTLTYEVEGERLFEQANEIWLEDEKGKPFDKGTPIRIQGRDHRYQLTFSNVRKTDSVFLSTPRFNAPVYLEELAVVVDLEG